MEQNTKKTAPKKKVTKAASDRATARFNAASLPMEGDSVDKPAMVSMDVVRKAFSDEVKRDTLRGRAYASGICKNVLRRIEAAIK